jgi:hypothetical protein
LANRQYDLNVTVPWGGLSERQRRRLQNKVYNLGGNERRHLLAEHMWPTTNTADQGRSA